jgi:hypothetical protein
MPVVPRGNPDPSVGRSEVFFAKKCHTELQTGQIDALYMPLTVGFFFPMLYSLTARVSSCPFSLFFSFSLN